MHREQASHLGNYPKSNAVYRKVLDISYDMCYDIRVGREVLSLVILIKSIYSIKHKHAKYMKHTLNTLHHEPCSDLWGFQRKEKGCLFGMRTASVRRTPCNAVERRKTYV